MRKLLKTLIAALVLMVGTSAFADYRIATVDLGRVFTNYWKTKQAQTVLDDKKADIEKSGKEMLATFNKAKEEYAKMQDLMNDPAVSATERDRRKKAADDKLKDLKDQDDALTSFGRGSNATMQELLKSTSDKILAEIRVVINAKAKSDGYTLVIDTAALAANGTPIVLYIVPGDTDITDAVIKQLNLGAPVDMPKEDDKSAPKAGNK